MLCHVGLRENGGILISIKHIYHFCFVRKEDTRPYVAQNLDVTGALPYHKEGNLERNFPQYI